MEWLTNGVDGEFGYGATSGENAGDWVVYSDLAGIHRIDAYDEATDEHAWVEVTEDQSGSVRLANFNAGEEACWGTTFEDEPCPE